MAELLLLWGGDSHVNSSPGVSEEKGLSVLPTSLPPQPAVVQNLLRTGYKMSNSIQNDHSSVLLKQR